MAGNNLIVLGSYHILHKYIPLNTVMGKSDQTVTPKITNKEIYQLLN